MKGSKKELEIKQNEIEVCGEYLIDGSKRLKTDLDTQIYTGRKKNTNEKVAFKLKKANSFDSYYLKKESQIYARS